MKLIGLTGVMGSGKDTVADMVMSNSQYDYDTFSFADPLKLALSSLFGEELYKYTDREHKESFNDVVDNMTRRELMQWLGTDVFRDKLGDDVWIRIAENNIKNGFYNDCEGLIQTSIRFDNEAEWLRRMGGTVIHVLRPNNPLTTDTAHASEQPVDIDMDNDIILFNRGSIQDLEELVIDIIDTKGF